jgi:hypothetical protein
MRVSGEDQFLFATVWESAEAAERSAGRPAQLTASAVLAEVAQVDSVLVYDALEPVFRGIVDAPGGVVRLTTAQLVPGMRPALVAWLADQARSRQPQRLVLGWATGERQVDGRHEMVGVSAWPSQLVVEALSEPGAAEGLLYADAGQFVTDVVVESYRAIGLDLPSELSDIGARRVLAARFDEREPADVSAVALAAAIPSAKEMPLSVAPLGAPGTASDVKSWILVVRVSVADYPRAERLIADHGGEVILAAREASSADEEPAAAADSDLGGLSPAPAPAH